MKGSESKLIKYMEGADKRFVIPVYQRKDITLVSTERVNTGTLVKDMTPFYGWSAEIEKIEMN